MCPSASNAPISPTSPLGIAITTALSKPWTPHKQLNCAAPAAANPAVARCTEAYTKALTEAHAQSKGWCDTNEDVHAAYREALPPLSGQKNIRAFIACIGHGILIRAIDRTDGVQLLYAAQVALSAHKARPHKRAKEVLPKHTQNASESPETDTQVKLNQ